MYNNSFAHGAKKIASEITQAGKRKKVATPSEFEVDNTNDSNYEPSIGVVVESSRMDNVELEMEDASDVDEELDPTLFTGPRKRSTTSEHHRAKAFSVYADLASSPTPQSYSQI